MWLAKICVFLFPYFLWCISLFTPPPLPPKKYHHPTSRPGLVLRNYKCLVVEKHRKSWGGRTQRRSRGQASKRRVGLALVGGGGGGGAAEPGRGRSAGAGWELRALATKQGVSRARGREAGPAGGGGVGAGPGCRTLGGTSTSGRGAGPAVWGEARVQEPSGQK